MKSSTKRAVYECVAPAVRVLKAAGYARRRDGFWTSDFAGGCHEVEVVFDPAYGEGVFRVEWGVRMRGVAAFIEKEEIDHAMHATIGGDLGSLAEGRSRWTMVAVRGTAVGLTARLLWGVKPGEPRDVAVRVERWVNESLLPVVSPLTSYVTVADFLGNAIATKRPGVLYPESERHLTLAALRALGDRKPESIGALDVWLASIPSVNKSIAGDLYRRIRARFDDMTSAPP